ncbi:MAG: hypothetical protein AABW79_04840 [Nanoarchaeota archaeon]
MVNQRTYQIIILVVSIIISSFEIFSENQAGRLGMAIQLIPLYFLIAVCIIIFIFKPDGKIIYIGQIISLVGYIAIIFSYYLGTFFSYYLIFIGLGIFTIGILITLIGLIKTSLTLTQSKTTFIATLSILIILPILASLIIIFNSCYFNSNDECILEKAIEQKDATICNKLVDNSQGGGGYNQRNSGCLCPYAVQADERKICAYCGLYDAGQVYLPKFDGGYGGGWEGCFASTTASEEGNQEFIREFYYILTNSKETPFSIKFFNSESEQMYLESNRQRWPDFIECYESTGGKYENVKNCLLQKESDTDFKEVVYGKGWPNEWDLGK